MAITEDTIAKSVKCVEDAFGECNLSKHTCTNCAVRYTKDEDGNVTLDQDEYIKQLRPIQHPELTGADADAQATKMVAYMFVSLRGALAYALITQACPRKIVYHAMNPTGEVDLHNDSGYQRLSGDADDDVKGCGIRGANLLRRGITPSGKPVVHLIDAYCKSRRLQARSSYSAETRAAAHTLEDCYPTI
eukprot:6942480-Pyramimonas_sp.AAC.1